MKKMLEWIGSFFISYKENKDTAINYSVYGAKSKDIKSLVDIDWRDLGEKAGYSRKGDMMALNRELKVIESKFKTEWDTQLLDIVSKQKEILNELSFIIKEPTRFGNSIERKLNNSNTKLISYEQDIRSFIEKDVLCNICTQDFELGFEIGGSKYKETDNYYKDLKDQLISIR